MSFSFQLLIAHSFLWLQRVFCRPRYEVIFTVLCFVRNRTKNSIFFQKNLFLNFDDLDKSKHLQSNHTLIFLDGNRNFAALLPEDSMFSLSVFSSN